MFNWFKGKKTPQKQTVRASYNAANRDTRTSEYWAGVSRMSLNKVVTPEVRELLADRATFIARNNSFAKGMLNTHVIDIVGNGPNLQSSIPSLSHDQNTEIETAFKKQCKAIKFHKKLRLMSRINCARGESFAQMFTNPRIGKLTKISLDLSIISTKRIATPYSKVTDEAISDGIKYDESGNPVTYYVSTGNFDFKTVGYEQMIHLFDTTEEEQRRGITHFDASLDKMAKLDLYGDATLTAAQRAAKMGMFLSTDIPLDMLSDVDTEDVEVGETGEVVDLPENGLLTLSPNTKVQSIRADQPTTNTVEYSKSLKGDAGRGLNQPYNIAAADSSGHNYASGRMDTQGYTRSIEIEQALLESEVLTPFYLKFIEEYRKTPEGMRLRIPDDAVVTHEWFWQSRPHVDPGKEAKAQEQRLLNGTTTRRIECAKDGRDWIELANQAAEEKKKYEELGLDYLVSKNEKESADGQTKTQEK